MDFLVLYIEWILFIALYFITYFALSYSEGFKKGFYYLFILTIIPIIPFVVLILASVSSMCVKKFIFEKIGYVKVIETKTIIDCISYYDDSSSRLNKQTNRVILDGDVRNLLNNDNIYFNYGNKNYVVFKTKDCKAYIKVASVYKKNIKL